MEMTEEEARELASQLGHPRGEDGIAVGERMLSTNINMIRTAAAGLPLNSSSKLVEVGHGNGLGASSLAIGRSVLADEKALKIARSNLKKTKLSIHSIPGFSKINDLGKVIKEPYSMSQTTNQAHPSRLRAIWTRTSCLPPSAGAVPFVVGIPRNAKSFSPHIFHLTFLCCS